MTQPAVHTETQAQYDALGAGLRYGDEAAGWPLLHLIDAWAHLLADVSDLVRDSDDGAGWTLLFDPDRCPYGWLPILAAFAGVTLEPGLPDADARARIKSAPARRRGTVGALMQAVTESLTGSRTVTLVERDGSPYVVTVQTYLAETPDAALTERKAELQTPAWLLLDFGAVPGPTWALVADTEWVDVDPALTWADVAALAPADFDLLP